MTVGVVEVGVVRQPGAEGERYRCACLKPDSITLAGSKLVADRFEAGRRAASNLSATSFEPASIMGFGFYTAHGLAGHGDRYQCGLDWGFLVLFNHAHSVTVFFLDTSAVSTGAVVHDIHTTFLKTKIINKSKGGSGLVAIKGLKVKDVRTIFF